MFVANPRKGSGIDPAKARALQMEEDRRAAALKQLELTSVGEVFRMMDALELSRRKDGGEAARRSYQKDIRPTLDNVPIRSLTRAHVMTLLDKIVARGSPVQTNRTFQLIGQLFKFAILREIAVTDPTRLRPMAHSLELPHYGDGKGPWASCGGCKKYGL